MSEQTEKPSALDETLYYLKPEERVDLTNCDREPIHIINHVQPHGVLLVFNPEDLTVVQASENTLAFFGSPAAEWIGKSADDLFAPEQVAELRKNVAEGGLEASPLYLFSAPVAGKGLFHSVAHLYRGLLLVELEPLAPEDASPDYYALVKTTLNRFEQAVNVRDFAQAVCEEVQRINGFDRVMVYKFLEDYSGEVIAEAIAPERSDWEPYLGLHYPASDIPKQARALYILNPVRLIPDAGYVPSPLVPAVNMRTGTPCDMSHASLRGVSSLHLEYLRNMGVYASMSLAIIKDGQLWGLVACHHHAPRRVAYDVRTACEFLVRVVSLQITDKEMQGQAAYRRRIEEMHHSLIGHIARKRTLMAALLDCEPNLMAFLDSSGCAVLLGGEYYHFGNAPDEAKVRALTQWLAANHPEEVYATNSLPAAYTRRAHSKPPPAACLRCVSRMAAAGIFSGFAPK